MSNYGIFNERFGGIADGHTALSLWSHGWGVYTQDLQAQQPLHLRWDFTFPQPPEGKQVLFFLSLEDDSKHAHFPIGIKGNKAMAIYNANHLSPPYFYVFTTDIPEIDNSEKYGIEVLGENGKIVFNSNVEPLKIIGIFNTNELSSKSYAGKDIAFSSIGTFILNAPLSGNALRVVTRYLNRQGDFVRMVEVQAEKRSQNPIAEGASFNRYFGASLNKVNLVTTIIDVSDIVKKPK